jgi:hypothetical protein
MKRTFANLVQKSLVAALLVFGALLFGTSSVEAQQSSGAQSWPSNWVDQGEALARIKTTVLAIHNDPQVQNAGSTAYIRAHYYKFLYRRIDNGELVHDAVQNCLETEGAVSTTWEEIPGVTLSPSQRSSLKSEAATLLAN